MLYVGRQYALPEPAFRFGDRRLNLRAEQCLHRLCQGNVQESFPKLFAGSGELKGFYRLMNHERVNPQRMVQASVESVRAWLAGKSVEERPRQLYCFQDTTYGCYNERTELELGYVQTKRGNGLLIHTALLTDEHFTPLSLGGQHFLRRDPAHYGKAKQRKERPFVDKESYKWVAVLESLKYLRRSTGVRIVSVSDQESDLKELIEYCWAEGLDFVLRTRHNRNVSVHEAVAPFWAYVRAQPPQAADYERVLLDEHGKPYTARCALYSGRVPFPSLSQAVGVVYLREHEAGPERKKAGQWALLTSLPVETDEQATEVLNIYTQRWRTCEDFHKCLKTGCRIEQRQFQSPEALINTITLLSIVAVRLLGLRHLASTEDERPLQPWLDETEQQLASLLAQQYLRPSDLEHCRPHTAKWFILLLGRMGGHQGFRHQGMPGWQTIWKGYKDFDNLIRGIRLARQLNLE